MNISKHYRKTYFFPPLNWRMIRSGNTWCCVKGERRKRKLLTNNMNTVKQKWRSQTFEIKSTLSIYSQVIALTSCLHPVYYLVQSMYSLKANWPEIPCHPVWTTPSAFQEIFMRFPTAQDGWGKKWMRVLATVRKRKGVSLWEGSSGKRDTG